MTESVFVEVPQDELVKRACDILSQERAKPRDIAWAWAFLSSLERGEPFGMDEKSYRAIHDVRQWILAQGFASTDSVGMPVTPPKGVSVSGTGDIENRMLVRLSDVRSKAKAQGLALPENQGVQIKAPKAIPRAPVQDEAILQIISELGYDPLNLPPFRRGDRFESVKQQIRTEALKNRTLFSENSFKKAWERLSNDKRILHPEAPKDSP